MRQWDLWSTEYPAVRRVMGTGRDRLDDEALEERLESLFPGASPEHVEDFMQTLQQFGRQAAPVFQKVAPAMAQGAVSGGTVAGPWGALAGALGGGAMSLLGGGGPSSGPAPQAAAAHPLPAAPVPAGAAPSAGGFGSPAPAQLLALLSRPETMQALLSLVLGASGRPTVSVGERQVPVTAFANAISELASEAAIAGAERDGTNTEYWNDRSGTPRCDVGSSAARAALVFNDLADSIADSAAFPDNAEEWSEAGFLDSESALDAFEALIEGAGFDGN